MRFPWQKDKTPEANAVKMRAAVVPKSYKVLIGKMVTENNFTVNSYSTHFVSLKVLQPGQTAKSLSQFAPGTVNIREPRPWADDGIQLVQFDAPNWVGVIVCTDGAVYYDHVELPVWVDPASGKISGVDVEEMLREMEPDRQRASEIWGEEDGPFSLYFQLKSLPGALVDTGKMLGSLPGTWLGAVKEMVADMKGEGKAPDPLPPHMLPDLSKYPPVEGMDWDTWVLLSAKPEKIMQLGIPQETWLNACRGWNERVQKDWKLGALYGTEVERARKSGV